MSFSKILDKYRKLSFSERDKGDRFERLMQAYMQTDPTYSNLFNYVWLWNEFPSKMDLGGKDVGIDMVARTYDGDYWAIQCKCFQKDSLIDKKSVDSFLATSSREFTNDENEKVRFTHRFWISTTNKWGTNAEEAIRNQNPPVSRLNLHDLEEAPIDWEKLDKGITGELARTVKKDIWPHQTKAVDKAHEYFKTNDRGKLIMACGTGKTLTALKIVENETDGNGLVLFLVPSIALIGQTLRGWTADSDEPINPICICSDSRITKTHSKQINFIDTNNSGLSIVDLAMPASTDVSNIKRQFERIKSANKKGMTVVFSTYQSIDVIAEAQKELMTSNIGFGEFDVIICDEAHRTTGVTLTGADESSFVKVHDNDFIKAKKRMYMTATPRLFSDDSKAKAKQYDAVLCSMDDPEVYGDEIYRIGFGEAVDNGLLTDYKVLILTLNENDVPEEVQKVIANPDNEINTDDASKLIGCINALSKQILGDEGLIKDSDPNPMKRAVAFCQTIKISKNITSTFNTASEIYLDSLVRDKRDKMVNVSSKHIDGTMRAPKRDELMSWLKSTSADSNECRVLTNVRCLSEGVDVPSLDSVMFLSARNSQVDVVQSVGRVMRLTPGKKYGYIIIPVVVPADIEPSKALDDNKRFKVVWSVLNALRAHDDRFNATINKIDLNKKRPGQILVGGIGGGSDGNKVSEPQTGYRDISKQLALQFEQLQSIVFARMVKKVGNKRYWEQWAKDVADIVQRQYDRISNLVEEDDEHRSIFNKFLSGLHKNINPSISKEEAVEMLSQHIITKPVFDALFNDYSFVENNSISVSMQSMLDLLESHTVEKDTRVLHKFYESVKMRASGIDNAEGKQKIIIELYDKFFKTAFPMMVDRLGIVYTPVEVVDFIIHSVNDILKQEFGRSLTDENVHILDPFVGTGTFITRLLQSGLIDEKDLERKYTKELHANEIVLLAYYIAAVNIENVYHDLLGIGKSYQTFEGICLTDTFQLGETEANEHLFSEMFPKNSERVVAQKNAPIKVIIGNPPYSIGQKSANDNAQNQFYPRLDERIEKTYAIESNAGLNKSLYDAYIKAFRWSSDRLGEDGGVIGFVSNGAWLDGNSQDGFRKCIENEYSSIYVFNLRGNARTQGEQRRKEKGNVFGGGSRTPISITLLIKNPNAKKEKAKIYYKDIGDYLPREEKLKIVSDFGEMTNPKLKLQNIKPNKHGDWINQRNDLFETFIPIQSKKKLDLNGQSYFVINGPGIASGRDSWIYNYSLNIVADRIEQMVSFYNRQRNEFFKIKRNNSDVKMESFINTNPSRISWTRALKKHLVNGTKLRFSKRNLAISDYRPFCKQFIYFHKPLLESPGLSKMFYPEKKYDNKIITLSSIGTHKGLSVLMSESIVDYHLSGDTQCFPLHYYEERDKQSLTIFDVTGDSKYIKRDGVSDFILNCAQEYYCDPVTKEDIFYYVYGILHCPDYKSTFANDLKKMLPRIPLVDKPKEFWAFSKAGRDLAELHINYESVAPCPDVTVMGDESEYYTVEKLRFPKKGEQNTIIYNSHIIISNIPNKAYEYEVNGKSAIAWIMERYQVKTDKKSGIKNDPNDWAKEVENPRYILDLLLSIINVSVQTVDIVNALPKLKFET
jgi:predicted helicase